MVRLQLWCLQGCFVGRKLGSVISPGVVSPVGAGTSSLWRERRARQPAGGEEGWWGSEHCRCVFKMLRDSALLLQGQSLLVSPQGVLAVGHTGEGSSPVPL